MTQFKERLAEKRKKGLEHLQEAKHEADQEHAEAAEAAAALQKRLSKKPVTFTLRSGEKVEGGIVTSFTLRDGVLELPQGRKKVRWEAVDPGSLGAIADVLFDPKSPKDQFERGKFFIARRVWAEAQKAWERASALGEGYASRVLEVKDRLDRLASDPGGFHGMARRVGPETVLLSYDLRDPSQASDWSAGLAVSGGSAVVDASQGPVYVLLRGGVEAGVHEAPLQFLNDLTVEMKVVASGPFSLSLFIGPKAGYEFELGPQAVRFLKFQADLPEKDRRRELDRSEKIKVSPGKPHTLRLRGRLWRFTVSIDNQPAVTFSDAPKSADQQAPHGAFLISVPAGKLRIEPPILLQGKIPKEDLERRVGETEVFLRRLLDPDLEEVRRGREQRWADEALHAGEAMTFTSDDRYFLDRAKVKKDYLDGYDALKRDYRKCFSDTKELTLEQWEKRVTDLIARYSEMPSLYYLRALARRELQDAAGARGDIKKALELFPGFVEALLLEGDEHLDEGELDLALEDANRVLDAEPDSASALVLRGRVLFAKSPAAQDVYREDLALARKLDPGGSSEASHYERTLDLQRRGPEDLGCRFDHSSAHYRVTTDISSDAAKTYGAALEAAWAHYVSVFPDVPLSGYRRMPRVAVFQTAENYYTYFELLSEDRGQHTLGVFRPDHNELVLFETPDASETMHTLYHEAFHHFMSLMTPDTPPFWYNEGMAEYMGAITVADGKIKHRAEILLGRLFSVKWALALRATIPFERIMNETPREFYNETEIDINYAQSWCMVHFFHEGAGGKYRPLIDRYFRALHDGKSPREAYNLAFREKVSELETEWKAYAKKLSP